jgi:cell division septal protein FtsQ
MRSARVAAPSDKRFKRAHIRPARKRGVWTRQRWRLVRACLLLTALGYTGYRSALLLQHATLLQVRRVVIRGNDRLSNGEVLALVDGVRGANILFVDLALWRQRVMKSPWVADAALHRVLPSTIEIAIVERTPMGIGRLGRELYLVDASGVIIDEYGPNYMEFDLPIIDGLAAALPGGPMIDPARAELASRVISSLRDRVDLARRLSQIDVSDVRNAVVVLEGETALVRLGDERFAERLQSYVELAAALHERVPDIDYVDLRFDDRVYVRPSAGPGRGAARANARPTGVRGMTGRRPKPG